MTHASKPHRLRGSPLAPSFVFIGTLLLAGTPPDSVRSQISNTDREKPQVSDIGRAVLRYRVQIARCEAAALAIAGHLSAGLSAVRHLSMWPERCPKDGQRAADQVRPGQIPTRRLCVSRQAITLILCAGFPDSGYQTVWTVSASHQTQ